MLVNKIGDVFIMIAIGFLLQLFGTVAFSEIFNYSLNIGDLNFLLFYDLLFITVPYFGYYFYINSLICFFLFLGIMAKSAQIGFHT